MESALREPHATPKTKGAEIEKGYIDMSIPFGTTHKGKLVADCPDRYLNWLVDQRWMQERKRFEQLFSMIKKELAYRKKFNIRVN
jgi:uncharacterized protein (DUF3820 family)